MRKPVALIALSVSFALAGWLSLAAQAPDGVVAGRVLGPDGNPAAGVRVAIVGLDVDGRVAFLGRVSGSAAHLPFPVPLRHSRPDHPRLDVAQPVFGFRLMPGAL